MNNIKQYVFFISLCGIVLSCNKKSETNYFPSWLQLQDTTLFQGIALNSAFTEVKTIEKSPLVSETEDVLQYRFTNDSLSVETEYGFNEAMLEEISCNIYPLSNTLGEQAYDVLVAKYRKKLGEPFSEKGYLNWVVKNNELGYITRVMVTTDISEKNLPIINLTIYKDIE